MRNTLTIFAFVGAFLFSLTSCGGNTVDTFAQKLENEGFDVEYFSDEDINSLEAIYRLAFTLEGYEDTDLDILNYVLAAKIDNEGTHSSEIIELSERNDAQNIYIILQKNKMLKDLKLY